MNYPTGFIEWLANGERGLSSNTIATVLSGLDCMPKGKKQSHPYDPSDFIRCDKLLGQVAQFYVRINEMKSVSPQWKVLIENWNRIREAIKNDRGIYRGKYPTAFNLMQTLLTEVSNA